MKKACCVGLIMMFIGLCGCLSPQIYTNPTNTPNPTNTLTPSPTVTPTPIEFTSWKDITSKYSFVMHEDIEYGKCNEQHVLVDFFVDDVNEIYSFGKLFDTLYDSYYIDVNGNLQKDFFFNFDWQEIGYFFNAKNGDKILALCYVEDNYPDIIYAIAYGYHENCEKMNDELYKIISRNPDNYLFNQYRISGKVIQVVEETDDVFELLVQTENGDILFVEYCRDSKERILLNDNVEIEGTFRGMETYKAVIGSNTVPSFLSYELKFVE